MASLEPTQHQTPLKNEFFFLDTDPLLYDFLLEISEIGTYAQSSLKLILGILSRFLDWLSLHDGLTWTLVSQENLQDYLGDCQCKDSQSTLCLRLWVLRLLYGWAAEAGHCPLHLVRTLACTPRSGKIKKNPHVLSELEVKRLLAMPNTSTPVGIRDRCILEFLYGTGTRAGEALSLQVHQINPRKRYLKLFGKGSKERLVIYGEHTAQWMLQYLQVRGQLLKAQSTNSLFVSACRPGNANISSPNLSYAQLRRLVQRYAQQARLKCSPHTLRHSFATHLYMNGADLSTIQMLLGHEHVATTSIYLSCRFLDTRKLLQEHHPRGELYVPIYQRRWGT